MDSKLGESIGKLLGLTFVLILLAGMCVAVTSALIDSLSGSRRQIGR